MIFRRFAVLAFALIPVLAGCAAETEEDDEEIGEANESELKAGCVKSNFNCTLPDHAYDNVDRNRFFTQTGNIKWSVAPNTVAVDGRGEPLGKVVSQIEINYGQRKTINGVPHVYGFRMTLAGGVPASAFVPESAVKGDTKRMPTVVHGNPGRGDGAKYRITGGNPAKFKDKQGRDLKISKNGTGNLEANDYLVRPQGSVHMLYSVPGFQIGGLATDTIRADRNVEFVRTRDVGSITVPTYSVSGVPGPDMKFVYGRVGQRWGWIALDALAPK